MKVSAISQVPSEELGRNSFIRFSNSFMSSPSAENPDGQESEEGIKHTKLGIENLQEFTIFPREVIDGRTVIKA